MSASTSSPFNSFVIKSTYLSLRWRSSHHNHIVRTVALARNAQYMLTGGQEKKIRLFDLNRPDVDPISIGNGEIAHDGVIKSVLWVGDWGGVSGGDDGLVKSVLYFRLSF